MSAFFSKLTNDRSIVDCPETELLPVFETNGLTIPSSIPFLSYSTLDRCCSVDAVTIAMR